MKHIAFDLGAESGRAILGEIVDGRLETNEIHRFATQGIFVNGSLRWDVYRLFAELKQALKIYADTYGNEPCTMGVDTWGVDFGILDKNGKLISIPYHYRDKRNIGTTQAIEEKMGLDKLYAKTGIEYMEINSLNQLIAAKAQDDPTIQCGEKLLFMADLLQYFLCGVAKAEFCLAATSCLLNNQDGTWADEVFDTFGIPKRLQPEIVRGGTVLGKIREDIALETGISPESLIITPPTHDTACAAAVVPKLGGNVAFLSSGTWSLAGLELDDAQITEEARLLNIANSGGPFQKILFLKSLTGLWLIQRSRLAWRRKQPDLSYDDIVKLAEKAEPFFGIIDTNDAMFGNPPDMPKAVCEYLRKTGQTSPESDDIGQISRIIMESLALQYKSAFADLCKASGRTLDMVNALGGGIQNKMLVRFTAEALGVPVFAGPIEATSAGNILMQAYGSGEISSLEDLRQIVINTYKPEVYQPQHAERWEKHYQAFQKIIGK